MYTYRPNAHVRMKCAHNKVIERRGLLIHHASAIIEFGAGAGIAIDAF